MKLKRKQLVFVVVGMILLSMVTVSAFAADGFEFTFEDGQEGWGPRGSARLSVVNDTAYSGEYSLLTTGRLADWHGPSINITEMVTAGQNYEITAWVKPISAGEIIVTMEKHDGIENSWDRIVDPVEVGPDEWFKLEGEYTIEEGFERFTLYIESPDPGLEYYIDSITAVEKVLIQEKEIQKAEAVIEGNLKEIWKNTPVTLSLEKNEYLSADVKLSWDNDYLYLLCDIYDPYFNNNDYIQIFIDEKNTKSGRISKDDFLYLIKRDGQFLGQGVSSEVREQANGYLVEAVIPLKTITPEIGTIIGFDIKLNSANSSTAWNDLDMNQARSTANYGNLIFTK